MTDNSKITLGQNEPRFSVEYEYQGRVLKKEFESEIEGIGFRDRIACLLKNKKFEEVKTAFCEK